MNATNSTSTSTSNNNSTTTNSVDRTDECAHYCTDRGCDCDRAKKYSFETSRGGTTRNTTRLGSQRMAEVVAPAGQAEAEAEAEASRPRPRPRPQPRLQGKKRAGDHSLESEQRLSKRFHLLNIRSSDAAAKHTQPGTVPAAPATLKKPERTLWPAPSDHLMQVEETPHRVYIHDLAAELSDTESDDEAPIFLSEIERHLAKIPKHVLLGPAPKVPEATLENQVVLYNVPTSLSVPEAQDSVRKAIVEARARVREKQANAVIEPGTMETASEMPVAMADVDAMDLD